MTSYFFFILIFFKNLFNLNKYLCFFTIFSFLFLFFISFLFLFIFFIFFLFIFYIFFSFISFLFLFSLFLSLNKLFFLLFSIFSHINTYSCTSETLPWCPAFLKSHGNNLHPI